jgi:hypothetical protein
VYSVVCTAGSVEQIDAFICGSFDDAVSRLNGIGNGVKGNDRAVIEGVYIYLRGVTEERDNNYQSVTRRIPSGHFLKTSEALPLIRTSSVARMGGKRNPYKLLVRKTEVERCR